MTDDAQGAAPHRVEAEPPQLRVLHYVTEEGDAALVRSLLRRSRQVRFEVIQVSSLPQVLDEARAGTCDVILADGNLPGAEGQSLLATLLAASDAAVVLSTQGDQTGTDWIATGAEDVILHRELASGLLARVLRHAVARHGVHSQLEASATKLRRELEMTQRNRELEQRLVLADRLASVGLLVAGVAHEINNPLTYVQLNLSWLLDRVNALGDSVDHELVDEMRLTLGENQEGMDHIRAVVSDLSAFARAGGDQVRELYLADVARSACNLVRNELRHRAQLVLEHAPGPAIVGERSRLIQLVVNLLVNAANAVEEGAADQNVVTLRTGPTDVGVGLMVEDSGCGIPPENLEKIFEPFFTTRSQSRGTGLGLSLCAETARRHGGTLSVTSVVGRGSRFTLELPLDTGLTLSLPSGPLTPPSPDTALRVLVVDDEAHLGTALARLMRPQHAVVVARDGGEALRILAQDSAFDAILCDVMMPVIDGPRLYAALTLEYPALVERVVFLTGEAFTPRARAFLSAVPNRVLQKPVGLDKVIDALVMASNPSGVPGW